MSDILYLWFIGDPNRPLLVGDLNLAMNGRGVSLRYSQEWLQIGFPLSEDLPLQDIEFFPREKDEAAGSVDDARPDRWGEKVIRMIDRPQRLSIMEFLYYAGDDRFGALGVSSSRTEYRPRQIGPLPGLNDIDALNEIVRKLLAGESVDEQQKRLIAPGVTMGGARPKALIGIDGAEWVLKFAEADRPDEPLIEHATMTMASKAGISVAETRPIRFHNGCAVAIRRFDREGNRRIHAISAKVALAAAGVDPSYPELALLLRRNGDADGDLNILQMRELFRRMVFNILIDNTDDHEKNHVLLRNRNGKLELSPAFDVLPAGHGLRYQSMIVGQRGSESSIGNALSMAGSFMLKPGEAEEDVARVMAVACNWKEHFVSHGISHASINALEPYVLATSLSNNNSMHNIQ